jgi:hypothetical protein
MNADTQSCNITFAKFEGQIVYAHYAILDIDMEDL